MLGCIQPMSSPMMKSMFGFCCCCAAAGIIVIMPAAMNAISGRHSFRRTVMFNHPLPSVALLKSEHARRIPIEGAPCDVDCLARGPTRRLKLSTDRTVCHDPQGDGVKRKHDSRLRHWCPVRVELL